MRRRLPASASDASLEALKQFKATRSASGAKFQVQKCPRHPGNPDATAAIRNVRFTSTPAMPETTSRLRNSGNSRMKSRINRCAGAVGLGVVSGLEADGPALTSALIAF